MIIWIASYPKSGNTYLRSFLASYYFTDDGKFNFDQLLKIHQFPNMKFSKLKSTNKEEASKNWIFNQNSFFILNVDKIIPSKNINYNDIFTDIKRDDDDDNTLKYIIIFFSIILLFHLGTFCNCSLKIIDISFLDDFLNIFASS